MGLENRLLIVVLLLFGVVLVPGILGATQQDFVLNLDTPRFGYIEGYFNDSNLTQQYDYDSPGNVTYWIKMPKDSTILGISFNITGKIVPIYGLNDESRGGILGLSIGDVTSDYGNEIVTGTNTQNGRLWMYYGINGTFLRGATFFGPNRVLSTDVGNITSDPGNEIVVGSENNRVSVLKWDESLDPDDYATEWEFTSEVDQDVFSVDVGDLDEDGVNEVVAGSDKLYALEYNGTKKWDYVTSSDVKAVAIGDVDSFYAGKEVILGAGTNLIILSFRGNVILNKNMGTAINSVFVGDIVTAAGNEIAIGAGNGRVYTIYANGTDIWNYLTGGEVGSVYIGDTVSGASGNEIVVGSNDGRVYTLDSFGSLIWDFVAEQPVKTVAIGNLTPDDGDEVVAGDNLGFLYTFNFDYFPENVQIDVNGDGVDWSSGYMKLRETEQATGFDATVQAFLNSCIPDASGNCDVPFMFLSDSPGRLNISDVYVKYNYSASSDITYQLVSAWSRTSDIDVNESVGNQAREITFDHTANNVLVQYVDVPETAGICDFNLSRESVITVNGNEVCDVPDFTVPSTGTLPSQALLWDDTLTTGMPVVMYELVPYTTTGINNYYWKQPLEITNTSSTIFTRVTSSFVLDENYINGGSFLMVNWKGQNCTLTPSAGTSDCDTSSPTYTQIACGPVVFDVCKKDVNQNRIVDYFKWVQPYTNGSISYEVGGETNTRPIVENESLVPDPAVWGTQFMYTVDVVEPENDHVNITLWVYNSDTDAWKRIGTNNMLTNGTTMFIPVSDKTWTGTNSYLFEYQDLDPSLIIPIHTNTNTTLVAGPTVLKHDVEFVEVQGHNSEVNRSESAPLVVHVNDTSNPSMPVSGATCIFWVTEDGSTYTTSYTNITNSSGFCHLSFTPGGNYDVGSQNWMAGLYGDMYYNDANSSSYNVDVKGRINITLANGGTFYRPGTNMIQAELRDLYGNLVSLDGYNCTFFYDSNFVGYTTTSSGSCNVNYIAACFADSLGTGSLDVEVNGTNTNYGIYMSSDSGPVTMKDYLNVLIMNPLDYSTFHKADTIELNSTVNDSCAETPTNPPYNVFWNAKYNRMIGMRLTETAGVQRSRQAVILTGAMINSSGVNLDEWKISNTHVLYGGVELPVTVKAWTDGTRKSISSGQIYLNQFSEVVFVTDLGSYETKDFWIYYNKENQTDYGFSYIENSGFESGGLGYWSCYDINCPSSDCSCDVVAESNTETYSAYLTANAASATNQQIVSQNVPVVGSDYIKIKFKAWGTYGDGSYIRLSSGTGFCDIQPPGTISQASAVWNTTTCNHVGFSMGNNINITVHDEGNGGTGISASNVYVDYVCIANSTYDCINYDSGDSITKSVITDDYIGGGLNKTWTIPANYTPGLIHVTSTASGNLYEPETETLILQVYGWSNVSNIGIESNECAVDGQTRCMTNATLDVLCQVMDDTSGYGVELYIVNFYGDDSYLGSTLSNSSGVARYTWVNSTDIPGFHDIICNITDQPSIYYHATLDNQNMTQINITSGNTTGEVVLDPASETAINVTAGNNYTFNLRIILNNTGYNTMFNPRVDIQTPSGVYATNVSCTPLGIGDYCDVTSIVTVTVAADTTTGIINVTGAWVNADATKALAHNKTDLTVESNPVLNITEKNISYAIPISATKLIGSFTVEAFGNDDIHNIIFDEYGFDAANISVWIDSYDPPAIASISKTATRTVDVYATMPSEVPQGSYYAYIRANSTGTLCVYSNNCWDSVFLNLTVISQDWEVYPQNMSKTIGLGSEDDVLEVMTIKNNRNQSFNFDITKDSQNGSTLINPAASTTSVYNLTSNIIDVYHNASSAAVGTYVTNITVSNSEGAVPDELIVAAELNIINLRVDLLSPNSSSPILDVVVGTEINMEVNATFNEVPIQQDMTWTALVSDVKCPVTSAVYNTTTTTWMIRCTSPEIPENPLSNPLKIIGNYTTLDGMVISDQNNNAVIYSDVSPPRFSDLTSDSVNQEDSVALITISADITDNSGNVDDAWIVVEYNSINTTITSYAKIGDRYIFEYPNPNVEAEYMVYLFANDSLGLENSTTGWFDVYVPMYILGNTTDPVGNNQSLSATFLKPGTDGVIHTYQTEVSAAKYNFTIRRRNYDVILSINETGIKFFTFNPTSSMLLQHNNSNARNLTNPFRVDLITLRDRDDIGNIALPIDAPDAARNLMLAYALETPFFVYGGATITLNYTQELKDIGSTITESSLRVYRCGSWNLNTRTCSSQFLMLSDVDATNVDVIGNTMEFGISSTSAYALAEWCNGYICGQSPPSPPTTPPGGGDTGGNSGGNTPQGDEAECGNGDCEIGENNLNCPADCESAFPFTVKTTIGDVRLQLGENKTYIMSITNNIQARISLLLGVSGEIEQFITFQNQTLDIDPEQTRNTNIYVSIPESTDTGIYTGTITVSSGKKTQEIPVTIRVSSSGDDSLTMLIDLITPTTTPNGDLKFSVDLENIGFNEKFNVTLFYFVKNGDTEEVVAVQNETIELTDVDSFIRTISLLGIDPPLGNYFLEVFAEFGDRSVKRIEPFDIVEDFWTSVMGQYIIYGIIIAVLAATGYVGRKRFKKWKKSKARYVFPLNYNKLPQATENAFWIGRIAETNKRAWFNPDDLTTHAVVAGSTGAGKSVSASVFVEEALERKIPVIVFDPTAQWTGFVKSLKDENLLKHYPMFGMDKMQVRPYKGMIFEVTDPNMEIDVKKYMIPGEITVFTLDKLKPGQYDEAVQKIIDSIFAVGWEESTTLKMLIVFDEVHRLLEKYGGKGGYIALEKACREFRKWGIGLIMCSQVLADFKEAVAGNVLTDVQLNTKSLTDIKKSREKYGEEYANRISRQSIGVGMLQNPKYNDGKPYFVNFRPTWHNPHKITDDEMNQYKSFAARLEIIEKKIADMEKSGQDVFDVKLELKLANDKLKLGNFRMAKIYITSLEEHLNITTKK